MEPIGWVLLIGMGGLLGFLLYGVLKKNEGEK